MSKTNQGVLIRGGGGGKGRALIERFTSFNSTAYCREIKTAKRKQPVRNTFKELKYVVRRVGGQTERTINHVGR